MKIQQKHTLKTPVTDENIIELYWLRDEKAIEETDFKYKNYLYSIAYNIVHEKSDTEECLNDTYLGAWNSMPPSRQNILKAFLTTIVRRVSINRYHSNSRKGRVPSEMTVCLSELENIISDDNDVDTEFDAKRLGCILTDFLRSLSERKRFIFLSRYYVADSIDAIAKNMSLSRSTVNKELAAIRRALKEKLESEGYYI